MRTLSTENPPGDIGAVSMCGRRAYQCPTQLLLASSGWHDSCCQHVPAGIREHAMLAVPVSARNWDRRSAYV